MISSACKKTYLQLELIIDRLVAKVVEERPRTVTNVVLRSVDDNICIKPRSLVALLNSGLEFDRSCNTLNSKIPLNIRTSLVKGCAFSYLEPRNRMIVRSEEIIRFEMPNKPLDILLFCAVFRPSKLQLSDI